MATYFVSDTYIKQNTPIYQNVESADILPHLANCQAIEIQKLLGTALYNNLISKITANTLTADEIALIEVIKPCLANYVYAASLPFSWAKFTARGIETKTTTTSQPISLKDVELLANKCKNLAEFYGQRIIDFLNNPENAGKYPLYYSSNSNQVTPERNTAYRCPIFLGDTIPNLKNSGIIQ